MSDFSCPPATLPVAKGDRAGEDSIVYGVGLSAAIAAAAFGLRGIPGMAVLSPMVLAIVLGMIFHNWVGTPARARAGVNFAMRRILRFAIMLLGFQLTVQQIADVGVAGISLIALSLVACFLFTSWMGALLGVKSNLTELIAAGTSICGASAVIATNSVTKAPDDDCAYAVVCVTLFGTAAMLAYPLLPDVLALGPRAYGLWAGASIHEVAQVAAAAYQNGKEAGDYGTIAKLTRVIMLAPMVVTLGLLVRRHGAGTTARAAAPIPYFILGFLAAAAANSMFAIPPMPKAAIMAVATFLLSLALAALGLETDFRKLKAKGARPLVLGGLATLFIAGFSLMLVKMVA